jgi:hypothetical protein
LFLIINHVLKYFGLDAEGKARTDSMKENRNTGT